MFNSSKILYLSAAIITNKKHQTLLVRKKNSSFYMQAGGKIEPNEQPLDALLRELNEELLLTIPSSQPRYVGEFTAPAANELGYTVQAHLFYLQLENRELNPAAELEDICWVTLNQAKQLSLAPLTQQIILPLLIKNNWLL